MKDKIIQKIQEKGSASLADLGTLHEIRHNILYHVRQLIKNEDIRAYIKLKPDSKSRSITDEEIIFAIANRYEYPKDILNLTDEICSQDKIIASQAYRLFVDLYVKRFDETEKARKQLEKKHYTKEHCTDNGFEEMWKEYLKGNEEKARQDADRLAKFLMSGINPELKKKVAFQLTYKDKNGLYNMRFD